MKRLKIKLQCNSFYFILIVFALVYILLFTIFIRYESEYTDGNSKLEVTILEKSISKNKVSFLFKDKEKIKGTYYLAAGEELALDIGDKVLIQGEVKTPSKNTIPNTFNYQRYLYNNKIYKTISLDSLQLQDKSKNILVKIKNFVYERCADDAYLLLFICGDKSLLDTETYSDFKNIGVAHLLAISGMHVSVFVAILTKLLFSLKSNQRKTFISFFLLFYSYIVDFSPSIMRVVLFYILSFVLEKMGINISSSKKLLLVAFILIMLNPFVIYNAGFQYSFITAYSILLSSKYHVKNYFINILIISFFALLFTLPITVQMNYEINLMTFISNLFLIPYVTYFLYPFALLYFLFPFLAEAFAFFVGLMETLVNYLSSFSLLVINIPKLAAWEIGLFYLFLYLFVYYNYKKYLVILFSLLVINKLNYKLDSNYYVLFFDVGQGDSSMIITPYQKDVVLIDTGGIISFTGEKTYNVSDNVILYLKSIGITKVDIFLISHGDYDHMGDGINLIKKISVDKVIFNNGEYNDLELELIKILEEKDIEYYQNVKELNVDNNKLYFLNKGTYDNENDNSNIVYTEINNYKFLFMGDAGADVEEDILEKYNLDDIDVLKVGHHGSKTSSSEEFISSINPKFSIISVGKNNRYGHPNNDVLENLNESNIYRTDQGGSILFKIKESKLEIENCIP